jgi:hypothetical protein
MIVRFAAGGSRTLGQRIIIENVLGARGTTGSIWAMRATPMATPSRWATRYPRRVGHLAYRPEADFAYIGLAVDHPS